MEKTLELQGKESEVLESLSRFVFDTACSRHQYESSEEIDDDEIIDGIIHLMDESHEVLTAHDTTGIESVKDLQAVLRTLSNTQYFKGEEEYVEKYNEVMHNHFDDEIADVIINALSIWRASGRTGRLMEKVLTNKMMYNILRKD